MPKNTTTKPKPPAHQVRIDPGLAGEVTAVASQAGLSLRAVTELSLRRLLEDVRETGKLPLPTLRLP